jgi:hypothetical protein
VGIIKGGAGALLRGKVIRLLVLPLSVGTLVLGLAASPSAAQMAPHSSTAAASPVPVTEMLPVAQHTFAPPRGTCEFVKSAGAGWCYYSKYSTGFEVGVRYGIRKGNTYTWRVIQAIA